MTFRHGFAQPVGGSLARRMPVAFYADPEFFFDTGGF
jgi:hypothetical protein